MTMLLPHRPLALPRSRRPVRCVALVLVALAAAVGVLAETALADSIPGAAANQHVAREEAARLLSELILPPGSTRVEETAAASPLQEPSLPPNPQRVDAHGVWQVTADPLGVIEWIQIHAPADWHWTTSVAATGSAGVVWTTSVSLPRVTGVPALPTVYVQTTGSAGGITTLRADAEVAWLAPRPGWEQVPAGVEAVTIAVGEPGESPRLRRVMGDAARVTRIVQLVDGLPLPGPGVERPASSEEDVVTLTFTGDGGVPLAVASVEDSGAGAVSFTVRGHTQPDLGGGRRLVRGLASILGVQLT
jgi:hypothetical protein